MPSVGSTPTLTSPQQQQSSQQQNAKLQLQHSLPIQLKLHLHKQQQQQQQQQHQQVTTTQPSPAGTFPLKSSTTMLGDALALDFGDVDEPSAMSSTNSFSSVDTNQTLLNSIATQAQQQKPQLPPPPTTTTTTTTKISSNGNKRAADATGGDDNSRSFRSKYGQFMIITPAVSIDRNFDHETGVSATDVITGNDESYFSNGNVFRMTLLRSSFDSGHSSDSSFCSNYNPNIHSSRYHLLPKAAPPTLYTFQSWRWCSLICAAMRCFGGGAQHQRSSRGGGPTAATTTTTTYNTYLVRPPYQRSRSSGIPGNSLPMHRLRSSSTSTELYASAYTPRKTRDHMNNITYEL